MTRPLAIVTGASTGIGAAFARLLATEGHDLLLCADERAVEDVASSVANEAGVAAEACIADLSEADGVLRLHERILELGRAPDVAVLNAGVGVWGRFDQVDLDQQLRVIDLNVRSTVHLAALLTRAMVRAGRGRLLLVSSVAGSAPGPGHATYAASKAFTSSFAQAARHELRDTGVSVTSLLPGPTDTPFFRRNDMEQSRVAQGPKDPADQVARDGYDAMMRGRDHVVGGRRLNAVQTAVSHLLPGRVTRVLAARETDRAD